MNMFIHQNGRLTDRDNIYNRLRTHYMQSLLVIREQKEKMNKLKALKLYLLTYLLGVAR